QGPQHRGGLVLVHRRLRRGLRDLRHHRLRPDMDARPTAALDLAAAGAGRARPRRHRPAVHPLRPFMRKLPLALASVAAGAVATPALAADLTVAVTLPRLNVAAYHRPYVAVWIERPDNTAVRTLAVWYQQTASREGDGKDWLKDMRTWWRRGGRSMTMPADGVSSATKAPGTHSVRVPAARLASLPAGDYVMVVEAAREL